jgi:competence protein ComEA
MFRFTLPFLMLVGLMTLHPGALAAQTKASSRPAAKPAGSTTAIVNLNSATAADLETLPGIGAKTAARIVEYRQKNGPFKKVEELMNVRGIGEKNFLKLKPQLTVAAAKTDQDPHQHQER